MNSSFATSSFHPIFFIYLALKQFFLKKIFPLIAFIFIHFIKVQGQSDSCNLQISLLTCSPGEELYATFGHSALRVKDSSSGTDIIYNYGTFAFGPDFYAKFIKGKLLYFVSTQNFNDFVEDYRWQSRSMVEQLLLLSCAEKAALFSALKTNALEQNKYYRYDFLFDNCSTRLRDIVAKNTGKPVIFKNILPEQIPTFRNLIHVYLNRAEQYWSKLGIDLLLGSRLDKKTSSIQAMFLPDYLLKGFDSAYINQLPLVTPPVTVLAVPGAIHSTPLLQPIVVFSVLLAIILVLSFTPSKKIQYGIKVFDICFFFFLGLIGLLLVFMWVGTDHALCRDNFNLLWALPTHAVAAFFLYSNSKCINYYLLATIILQTFLLIGWIFIPQEMNLGFLPLILIILLRSWLIILKPHHTTNAKVD